MARIDAKTPFTFMSRTRSWTSGQTGRSCAGVPVQSSIGETPAVVYSVG